MKITKMKIGALIATLAVASSITAFAANDNASAQMKLVAIETTPAIEATKISGDVDITKLPDGTVFMDKIDLTDSTEAAALVPATEIAK